MYIAERLTLLSAIARSMDDSKRCCGLWYVEREPRRNMTADRSREKLNLQRSQNNVLLYDLSAINDASLLNTTVAVDPNPHVVENNTKSTQAYSYALVAHNYIYT